jgi:flagellar biosynthesis anti-sigma factor FlgM
MKVSSGNEDLLQVSQSQTAATDPAKKIGANAPAETLNVDKAELSAAASKAAQSSSDSDVRLDKVASIRNALQAGTYSVPASAVAQKVVDSMLVSAK